MAEKLNTPAVEERDTLLAKVVGMGLVVLGLLFILFALAVILLSKRAPVLDDNIASPTFTQSSVSINSDTYTVQGHALPDSDVIVYVDGKEKVDYVHTDKDGNFSVEISPLEEGEHKIEVAQLRGFPKRKRSPKSVAMAVTVDKTAPADVADLEFDPVSTDGTFRINGVAEPYAMVQLRDMDGNTVAQTKADQNGFFLISGVKLNAAESSYRLALLDGAGNETVSVREIDVNYPGYEDQTVAQNDSQEGAEDTGASTMASADDTETQALPESAGSLTEAMDTIRQNNMLAMVTLLGLAVFTINSGVVVLRLKQNR